MARIRKFDLYSQTNEKIYNLALYYRLSREDGDKTESDSIVNQRNLLMQYIADKQEFKLVDTYSDDGWSGYTFERPDFKRLLKDIEENKINCIIVKDLSRLGRNYIDAGYYIQRYFPKMNVRFIAVNDNVDTLKIQDDIMMPIRNIMNEQYCIDISKKVSSAFLSKQREGQFIGSFPSYGYFKSPQDKHKLVIDTYAADTVKRIYQMFAAGYTKQKIANRLNDENILCPSAYKISLGTGYVNGRIYNNKYAWSYNTIHEILKREMYVGNMVQHTCRTKGIRGKQEKLPQAEYIIVNNTHPAIIDQDTWNKTQKLLKKDTWNAQSSQYKLSPLSGFVRCGDCGKAMVKYYSYTKKDVGRIYYFACASYKRYGKNICSKHSIRYSFLEKIILDDLNSCIKTVHNIAELVEKNRTEDKSKEKMIEIEKSNFEIVRYERLCKDLYEDYKESIILKEELLKYKSDYIQKIEMLKKRIQNLESKAKESAISDSSWICNLIQYKNIISLDREIVTEIVEVIKVYEDNRIEITYNFSDELDSLLRSEYETL